MKCLSSFCALAIACILLPISARAAEPDLRQWSHSAPINLPTPPAKGLVELPLPPELFALSRPDLGDLRLATESRQSVPYITRIDLGEPPHSQSYQPRRMFNPTFIPNRQSTVTVDFGDRATRTRVDIETPGTNFRRLVTVEAGDDGTTWQILRKSAWLFRISADSSNYSKTDVPLPDNEFRYLRITVFNAPDDPEQVPITKVQAWFAKSTPAPIIDLPVSSPAVTENAKLHATEIEADLGFENLPLHDAALAFDDANFLRRAEVYGRNARTRTIIQPVENSQPRKTTVDEPWISIGGGTVYRLPAGDNQDPSINLTLPLRGQYRYLLIRIFNADDKPLKFTGLHVRRPPFYLAFSPSPAGPYRLYTGNVEATRPEYDLQTFADRLRTEDVTPAALGPLVPNPLYAPAAKTVPWSERYAWLLWTALIAVGIVLAALVVRQAKRTPPAA